jgi:hypothetical protein
MFAYPGALLLQAKGSRPGWVRGGVACLRQTMSGLMGWAAIASDIRPRDHRVIADIDLIARARPALGGRPAWTSPSAKPANNISPWDGLGASHRRIVHERIRCN